MNMKTAVAYIRVSTQQQGRAGLGVEAQSSASKEFAVREGFDVAGEFVEVETGKGADALERRPQLAAALLQPVNIELSEPRNTSEVAKILLATWRGEWCCCGTRWDTGFPVLPARSDPLLRCWAVQGPTFWS